jgi:low affinity Fe/Cu permease
MHLKLNELLASHRAADNHLIGIGHATEEELRRLAAAYLRLSTKNPNDVDIVQAAADVKACCEERAGA